MGGRSVDVYQTLNKYFATRCKIFKVQQTSNNALVDKLLNIKPCKSRLGITIPKLVKLLYIKRLCFVKLKYTVVLVPCTL